MSTEASIRGRPETADNTSDGSCAYSGRWLNLEELGYMSMTMKAAPAGV